MKYLLILIFPVTLWAKGSSVESDLLKLKKMKRVHSRKIAKIVKKNSSKYNIDHRIMLAILKIESNIEQVAINKYKCEDKGAECGDFSIAQINYKTWKKRLNIDLHKLKSKNSYAISIMARILKIVKGKDKLWFLKYHSYSTLFKIRYLRMIEPQLSRLGYKIDYKAKEALLRKAVMKYGWKRVMALYTKIPSVDKLVKY